MNTRGSLSSVFFRLKTVGIIVMLILLSVWWGIPEFNKWQADEMVDELCAKDAGIKVYETVKLPEESFSSSKNFSKITGIYLPEKKYVQPTDEYYYTSERQWIIPKGTEIRNLSLWKSHYRIFRVTDGKLLAVDVNYTRLGGDAVGPWHPSHYGCVRTPGIKNVKQQVFIKK